MDDYTANILTTGVLPLNGNVNGSLEVAGDLDWFRVSLEQFYDYQVVVTSPDNSLRGEDQEYALIGLYNSTGAKLNSSNTGFDAQSAAQFIFNGTSGNYFVEMSAFEFFGQPFQDAPVAGNYRLRLETFDSLPDQVTSTRGLRYFDFRRMGSVVDTVGDRDHVGQWLPGGMQHTIHLLGADTGNGTLENPNLRVFNSDGELVAADNNSGTGRNARVILPATAEGESYIFQMSGIGGIGTYELTSDSFDDFSNNTTTSGILAVDSSGADGIFNFGQDEDWFQFEMRPGHRYEFTGGNGSLLRLYDQNGVFIAGGFNSFRRKNSNQNSASFFVGVTGGSLDSGVPYRIQAETLDDRGSLPDTATFWNLVDFTTTLGAIETVGDRDWLRVNLVKYGRYTFSTNGVGPFALSNAAVSVRDRELNVIANGPDGTVTLQPQEDQTVYISFRSNNDQQTGSYRFSTFFDRAAGDNTTLWNVNLTATGGRVRNAIETLEDVDYHRVHMTAGHWYQIEATGTDSFEIELPNGVSRTFEAVNHLGNARPTYFFAYQTGDHYLVTSSTLLATRSNQRQIGGYEFKIFEDARRPLGGGLANNPGQIMGAGDQIRFTNGLFGDSFEVFSTVPLTFNSSGGSQTLATDQLVTLTSDEWTSLTVPLEFQGNGDVFSRATRTIAGFTDVSNWIRTSVSGYVPSPSIRREVDYLQSPGHTFAFADGLPSYFVGDVRFSQFEALSGADQTSVRNALSSWANASPDVFFSEIAPGANNDAADTMIFRANIDSDVLAFRLGDDEGADLILNMNSPVMSDLSRGGQGLYEVVRGIGTILGLREATHVGRNLTVMGLSTSNLSDTIAFPSTPLPLDINALNRTEQRQNPVGPTTDDVYELSGASFYETIIDAGGRDTITAAGMAGRVTIDLRPDRRSFIDLGDSQPHSFFTSNRTFIENAIGGRFSDRLIGGPFSNSLTGGNGNDTLQGGPGTDFLFGGRNNDRYVFQVGDGADTINEQNLNGFDSLEIQSPVSLNSLADDLTFERIQTDLLIRLEMDGLPDQNNDQILIRNFQNGASRVETLRLSDGSNTFATISLVSVFNQLTIARQRFETAAGNDRWGSLVTPV